MRSNVLVRCAGVAAAFAGSIVLADGFRNPPDGALSLGRIGGTYAQIDDASTVSRNPANMTDIKQPEYCVSVTLGYGEKKFTRPSEVAATGAGGSFDTTAKSVNNFAALPDVYVVYPLQEKLVAGFALTTPFGRSTTWDKDNSLFRYTAPYYSQLIGINANPNIALKINDSISFAAGVDVLWSSLDIKQVYPWSAVTGNPASPDGDSEMYGDGVGFGGNAALNFKVTGKQKISLSYRSPISVHYDGTTKITEIPAGLPPPLSGVTHSSSFGSDVTFPAVAAIAYGIELTETVRVEADVEWVQHSTFDDLTVDAGSNNVLLPASTLPGNWTDTWTYGLGADWKFAPEWTARAGWIHLDTPIPETTQIPSIAEQDQNVASIGLGWAGKNRRVDLAYAYGFLSSRHVDNNANPLYDGTYDFNSQLLALSYDSKF